MPCHFFLFHKSSCRVRSNDVEFLFILISLQKTKDSHSLTSKGEKKPVAQKPILQKSRVMPKSQHLAEIRFESLCVDVSLSQRHLDSFCSSEEADWPPVACVQLWVADCLPWTCSSKLSPLSPT